MGCPEFVKKGYRSQLRPINMLKNKNQTLLLKQGKDLKIYVPNRFIRSYLDFMSHPTQGHTITPAGKKVLAEYFTIGEHRKRQTWQSAMQSLPFL